MMKKRVNNYIGSWLMLVFFIYLFIFSIELIKKASLFLAPNIKFFFSQSLVPIKAVSMGWFTTAIVQSSGAVGSVAAAFAGNDLITLQTAIFILIGASLGTTITALIISLIIVAKKRRDFRHGFEIGLCHAIYSVILVIIVFFLEYFFKLFSKMSFYLASILGERVSLLKIPDFVGLMTNPLTDFLLSNGNKLLFLILGFAVLIFTLRYISKFVMEVLGGEEESRKFINRHFKSKYKAYFLGFLLTAIVFSSGITIGLLVPLAAVRLINLKKAIPFILGARLGTFSDIFLASVLIGKTNALASSLAFLLFAVIGTIIFFPNTNFLFNATKYCSKKLIHISRKKALYILIAFILIPLLILIIF